MLKMQHNKRHCLFHPAMECIKRCEASCKILSLFQSLFRSVGKNALAGLSSRTTSEIQATIKGWWWLKKITTTLWCNSGWINWLLRTTYICPTNWRTKCVRNRSAKRTWPAYCLMCSCQTEHLAFEGQLKKEYTKLEDSRNASKGSRSQMNALWFESSQKIFIHKNNLRWLTVSC